MLLQVRQRKKPQKKRLNLKEEKRLEDGGEAEGAGEDVAELVEVLPPRPNRLEQAAVLHTSRLQRLPLLK